MREKGMDLRSARGPRLLCTNKRAMKLLYAQSRLLLLFSYQFFWSPRPDFTAGNSRRRINDEPGSLPHNSLHSTSLHLSSPLFLPQLPFTLAAPLNRASLVQGKGNSKDDLFMTP